MPPTLWTVVVSAGEGASDALEHLCRTYWHPIRAYICRWNVDPSDADDLTQMFLVHLLAMNRLVRVQPAKGRFRSYLLTALKHFLMDQKAKAAHQSPPTVLLQANDEFGETDWDPPDRRPAPDKEFDRVFAQELIRQTLARLQGEYAERGQEERFQLLQRFLPGRDPELSQAEAGARLGLTEGAVASAVHDLRLRFREVFRELVGQTVVAYEEVDEEIAHHIQVLSQD
ncbi:MAG: sigma-70 family RNA polymerase sigma factor [Verrucomicrobia bacterium]|nr:sigma-70 family RNA polymerase sigma factor [Verrucomicrobiota bacterium]